VWGLSDPLPNTKTKEHGYFSLIMNSTFGCTPNNASLSALGFGKNHMEKENTNQ
jgi:hypothetical protein